MLELPSLTMEAELLKILGHPVRLRIVAGLLHRQCRVGELWQCLGLTQAEVSRHLALLREAQVVVGERQGRHVRYRLADPRVERLVGALASAG